MLSLIDYLMMDVWEFFLLMNTMLQSCIDLIHTKTIVEQKISRPKNAPKTHSDPYFDIATFFL